MLFSLLFLAIIAIARSQSLFSNALGSNMVLQRAPQEAVIWGWTSVAAATVKISFNDNVYQTTSGSSNAWSYALPATNAGGPYNISASSSDGLSQTLTNVLFGDVWICSGQSNMQFTVNMAFNATQEIALAQNYPNIRLFTVGQSTVSPTPLEWFAAVEQGWSVANSNNINGPAWGWFSATCWFTAKNVYDEFQVPLGLVSSNWGGTMIQAWSSQAALNVCSSAADEVKSVPHYNVGQPNPNVNSVLWNAMIVPLLPMRVVGTIWYQAEQNVNLNQDQYYECAFPAMINDWRNEFGYTADDFGFFFAQLAPYTQGGWPVLPQMRIAQTAALALPNVGMAVTIDLGDPFSPEGNIHPRDKEAVGMRMSLAIRGVYYGQDIQYTGPTFESYSVIQNAPEAQVQINFVPSSIGSGLKINDAECPSAIGVPSCGWPTIVTSDGAMTNATVSISGDNVIFSATVASGVNVTGVTYAYNDWPIAYIFNDEGLPAPPFYAVTPSQF